MSETLEEKLARAQAETAEIEAQIALQKRLKPYQRVAESLHDKLCHWNHDDGCDWFYESWERPLGEYGSRKRYAEKAEKLLQYENEDRLLKIISLL